MIYLFKEFEEVIVPKYSRRLLFTVPIRLSLAILCIACSCLSQEKMNWPSVKEKIRKQFPSVAQLSTEKLALWLNTSDTTKPVLLDARALKEFKTSHLHDAKFAGSEKEVLKAIQDLNHGHPIVVYCSVGYRSSKLAAQLKDRGFKDVYNLEGSIFQWANEGRPVYSKGVEVKQVHPFNREWGKLLKKELWAKSEKDHE